MKRHAMKWKLSFRAVKRGFMMCGLCLCFCGSLSAQQGGVVYPEAFYVSADLGGALAGGSFAPSAGVTAGYWISTPLAFQVDLHGALGSNSILLADAEFKWDINQTFFHIYNENFLKPIPFYGLLGLGAMWEFADQTDRSFQAMVGLQVPMRVGKRTDFFFQYKCHILPNSFGTGEVGLMHMLGLGILYSQHADPFHRRPEFESRNKLEDWFIGFGIGPNYSVFDLGSNEAHNGLEMLGVAPEIMFGRNFSNFWAVRFELTGLSAREQYDEVREDFGDRYSLTMAHFDVMVNMSHLLYFHRGVKWNFMPYLGAGAVWRYDRDSVDMVGNIGLFVRRYVNTHSDVFIDLRYVMMPPYIAGGSGSTGNSLGVALPSLTFGYIYNFGRSTTRYRLPYNCAD